MSLLVFLLSLVFTFESLNFFMIFVKVDFGKVLYGLFQFCSGAPTTISCIIVILLRKKYSRSLTIWIKSTMHVGIYSDCVYLPKKKLVASGFSDIFLKFRFQRRFFSIFNQHKQQMRMDMANVFQILYGSISTTSMCIISVVLCVIMNGEFDAQVCVVSI